MTDNRLRYKACSTCKSSKPVSDFSRDANRPDGKRSNCKDCARVSKAAWHERHKAADKSKTQIQRAAVKEYVTSRKGTPCVDCGSRYHHSLMDFDHIDPSKKRGSVSRVANETHSVRITEEEIDKCELVCCMCHRVRTWNRMYPEDTISNLPLRYS